MNCGFQCSTGTLREYAKQFKNKGIVAPNPYKLEFSELRLFSSSIVKTTSVGHINLKEFQFLPCSFINIKIWKSYSYDICNLWLSYFHKNSKQAILVVPNCLLFIVLQITYVRRYSWNLCLKSIFLNALHATIPFITTILIN